MKERQENKGEPTKVVTSFNSIREIERLREMFLVQFESERNALLRTNHRTFVGTMAAKEPIRQGLPGESGQAKNTVWFTFVAEYLHGGWREITCFPDLLSQSKLTPEQLKNSEPMWTSW